MPFKSKSQQRFMFARHPKMAREWAHETKDIKSLPEKVNQKKGKEKKAMHPATINAFVDELNKIAQVEKTSGLPSYLKGMVRSGQGLANVSRGVDAMGNAAQKTLMTKNLGQAASGKLMSHVHGRMAGAAMGANPVAAGKLVRQGQRAASIGREGMQAAAPQAARLAPKPMATAAPAMKAVG